MGVLHGDGRQPGGDRRSPRFYRHFVGLRRVSRPDDSVVAATLDGNDGFFARHPPVDPNSGVRDPAGLLRRTVSVRLS